tara:strand:- start:11 stop:307 length:297 start_codon:yes stop_codon:yes gene_type:complete
MYSKSKIKNSYYDLKAVFREIKNKKKQLKTKDEGRFEDVPKELSDRDKEGSYKFASYMDYYLGIKFNQDKKDEVQPSGMTAKNKNYDYANAKFIESLK